MQFPHVSVTYTTHSFDLDYNSGHPPPINGVVEDLTKITLREGSPNLLKVTLKFICWKATTKSTCSCDANQLSKPKDSSVPSSSLFFICRAHFNRDSISPKRGSSNPHQSIWLPQHHWHNSTHSKPCHLGLPALPSLSVECFSCLL